MASHSNHVYAGNGPPPNNYMELSYPEPGRGNTSSDPTPGYNYMAGSTNLMGGPTGVPRYSEREHQAPSAKPPWVYDPEDAARKLQQQREAAGPTWSWKNKKTRKKTYWIGGTVVVLVGCIAAGVYIGLEGSSGRTT